MKIGHLRKLEFNPFMFPVRSLQVREVMQYAQGHTAHWRTGLGPEPEPWCSAENVLGGGGGKKEEKEEDKNKEQGGEERRGKREEKEKRKEKGKKRGREVKQM